MHNKSAITDFHCHVLPGIDDGSPDVETSRQMLLLLQSQGAGRVMATPHYHRHRGKTETYLQHRREAWELLQSVVPEGLAVALGAEVHLERDLYQEERLPEFSFSLDGRPAILLEFPYGESYRGWMGEEVHNIACTFGLVPVLAHVERYLQWYSPAQMAEALAIPDTVIQCNCESLKDRRTLKFILSLAKQGRRMLFGSDAHNLTSRRPNLDLFFSVLGNKLSAERWDLQLHWNGGCSESGLHGFTE